MTSREAFLVLNAVPGVGPITVRRLLERFGDAGEILRARPRQLQEVQGVGPEISSRIAEGLANFDLSAELGKLEALGARVVLPEDEEYPALLSEIYDPPVVLYARGKLAPDRPCLAVVGSRQTSYYGIETSRKLCGRLAELGFSIASGLARGIDTAAHQGALQARGHTVAVLGCGLDVVYPPENEKLVAGILEGGGAILSEFPLGTRPSKQTFPRRNRIVSGMSLGTMVVEADVESGAMITAHLANEQGRQVFAVPGRIDSGQARGCHKLIKEGAKLVEGVEDILCEFEHLFAPRRCEIANDDGPQTHAAPIRALSAEQRKIYDVLLDEAVEIDQITALSGLEPAIVSSGLLMLEMKKLVKQFPGKRFSRS
ncbi:MAG: DNA-protecting protein DprA [Verrucomicrobiae bacterium]|nr:DNA-protecting protein DprA [Verrucomicrobiae bacterium]